MKYKKMIITLMAILVSSISLAEQIRWVGTAGDGLWFTASNWDLDRVPNPDDDVIIENGDVEYVPGGDLTITGSLTIGNGGSWTQTGGGAWVQLRGELVVAGGTFNQGSAGNINIGDLTQYPNTKVVLYGGQLNLSSNLNCPLIMNGGSYQVTGSYMFTDSLALNGGTLTVSNEFQWNSSGLTISGNVVAGIFAGQGGSGQLNLANGVITIKNSGFDGYYQGSSYLNFPVNSKASIVFESVTSADVYSMYFSGVNPRIRHDGEAITQAEFEELFEVTYLTPDSTTGFEISLKQAEAGLPVVSADGATVSSITSSSATMNIAIDDVGVPTGDIKVYYGATNGGRDAANWDSFVSAGSAVVGANSYVLDNLTADTSYYYGMSIANSSGEVFARTRPQSFYTGVISMEADALEIDENQGVVNVTFARAESADAIRTELDIPYVVSTSDGAVWEDTTAGTAKIAQNSSSVVVPLKAIPDWKSSADKHIRVTFGNGAFVSSESVLDITFLNHSLPVAVTNVFLATVSDDASVAENWSLGVPTQDHVIYYDESMSGNTRLLWQSGMTDTVAGWIQTKPTLADSNFYVVFQTTPDKEFVVTGDVELNGGVWTCDGPSEAGLDPVYALNVRVDGDLIISSDAEITVGNNIEHLNNQKYYAKGYRQCGPGFLLGAGASFAGEGGRKAEFGTSYVTYGSVLDPMSWGSAGRGDSSSAAFAGAGIIRLDVAGSLVNNGKITAKGFGWPLLALDESCASSGGSINLSANDLVGSGIISANGGLEGTATPTADGGSGSGGRIAIVLNTALSSYTGSITSYGNVGDPLTGIGYSASGTIAIAENGVGRDRAVVRVDNNGRTLKAEPTEENPDPVDVPVCYTHLGNTLDGEQVDVLSSTSWVVENYGALRVNRDVKIASLEIVGENALVALDGYKVRVDKLIVDGVTYTPGVYTQASLGSCIATDGSIEVIPPCTVIVIY